MGAANHVLDVGVDAPWEGALLGVSGQLKSIVKHRILLFVVDTNERLAFVEGVELGNQTQTCNIVNTNERLGCVEGVELGNWTEACNIAQSHGRSDVLAVQ